MYINIFMNSLKWRNFALIRNSFALIRKSFARDNFPFQNELDELSYINISVKLINVSSMEIIHQKFRKAL